MKFQVSMIRSTACLIAASAFLLPARGKTFNLGEDASLDVDTTITHGLAWRMEDRDQALLQSPNGDDGNRNFDQGDLINNRFSITADIDAQYRDYGIFLRPRAYYDFVYNEDQFLDDTKELHRDKVELLDAFIYGTWDLSGHFLDIRLGRQVISWGESLFLQNSISSAQSPIDATAANAPGVELRDIFLPVGQAYASIDLAPTLTLSGYYQWEWEASRLDESGSYFSDTDYLYEPNLPFGPFNNAGITDADDSGQWGIALRYLAEDLNDTEFGFYYLNYHEKFPQVNFQAAPLIYRINYAEDVKLAGFSFGTVFGDTQVSGEVSWRQDYPVAVIVPPAVNPAGFTYEEADVLQPQISITRILPGSAFWEQLTLLGEVGFNHVYNEGSNTLRNDGFSWGGTVRGTFTYYQILQGLDLSVPLTYKFNPKGDSSVTGSFKENDDALGVALDFTYLNELRIGLGYSLFMNAGSKADRDFLSLSAKYTF